MWKIFHLTWRAGQARGARGGWPRCTKFAVWCAGVLVAGSLSLVQNWRRQCQFKPFFGW